jgi:hypothetical protein
MIWKKIPILLGAVAIYNVCGVDRGISRIIIFVGTAGQACQFYMMRRVTLAFPWSPVGLQQDIWFNNPIPGL